MNPKRVLVTFDLAVGGLAIPTATLADATPKTSAMKRPLQ